ncbi:MAG: HEAT repeat domain-containing protein [Armatimonadetes bacterium]|nr:HEAT repeat domain-containing protein [Armatimonadota bacterium]
MAQPILLSDEEVSRFITDGYLILDCGLPETLHARIYERLQWVFGKEGNPGNNILPAVPEFQQVLDSPRIQGALMSVLGSDYILHPHRFVHNNEPGKRTEEGELIGNGSQTFIGWHQDDHSPLSRPRHHYPRYAMILYYPQDTFDHVGPTQLIPATHLHRSISDTDKSRTLKGSGRAGTCVLVHFDTVHGGSLNLADYSRYMAKFVFMRASNPQAPSWNNQAPEWHTPKGHQSPVESPVVWSQIWNWMRGVQVNRNPTPRAIHSVESLVQTLEESTSLEARVSAINALATLGNSAEAAIPTLLNALSGEEYLRQNALYALAAIGEPAILPLIERLKACSENRWTESANAMENESYALSAIGASAVPALIGLLSHENEWVQINALFALGEIGKPARSAFWDVCAKLRSPAHPVVRTALDALGQIGGEEEEVLPELRRLFTESNPDWQSWMYRTWTGENQVRVNAMTALLRLGYDSEEAIQTAALALNDPCGYVGGFGVEYLLRRDSLTALRAAAAFLKAHRWDDSLRKGVRTF